MPKMTRSHYNLIADTIAGFKELVAPDVHSQMCTNMAQALAGTNSQFKFDRFKERCAGNYRGR